MSYQLPKQPQHSPRMSSIASSGTGSSSPPRNAAGRKLPDRNINNDNIEGAYVDFVLYCNPYLSGATDTTELRKGFRSLPKTDGKTFSPHPLFELIKKLEAKEIETWAQLVVEMGVKQPDVAIGQSTQKVQQYAVRLKRWLHAFHIDAFFWYCLGIANSYYKDLPQVSDVSELSMRDGVLPEEDLALRALCPEWRPKRGRRPNDTGSKSSPSAKRQMRASSLNAEDYIPSSSLTMSAYPQSAGPWDRQTTPSDPWLAAQRAFAPRAEQVHPAQQAETQPTHSIENHTSFYVENDSTYPQSAIHTRPPMSAYPMSAVPQSAHPSDSSHRSRKRHGPHVSAAWTPDGSGGKVRGRPPANRTTQDGPFSTFPAKVAKMSAAPLQSPAPPEPQSSQSQRAPQPHGLSQTTQQLTPSSAQTADSPFSANTRRPSKLQLQVPQHAGGPVRLATPPRVLLNGGQSGQGMERRTSADFFNSLGDDASDITNDDPRQEVDWKRRALNLQRKVKELEAELKAVKRRVLEAVM